MARKLDENVVSLQFDNKDVNRNVAQTMKLLQDLQEVLQFHDAGRSFTSLTKAANAVQLTGIQNAVGNLEKRFSAFGIASTRIIWDLTGLIEKKLGGAVTKLWSNTIGQAQSGGFKRALNIKQAQFQMKGLLKDSENMEEQLEQMHVSINDAVSGTAYSYDAAAKVGAQLLASQVKTGEDMTKALRAVSGLAAMTNTSYEEIGNIITDIAGQGKLSNEMLTRFSYRGMNAAAALGKQLGKTEEEIHQMVKKGEIDFQTFVNAMDDAFGEHATAANETYTGSLDNMKAALSRIGAVFYEDHLDVMRDIFNALRVAINAVNKVITPFIKGITAIERAIADRFINKVNQFTEWLTHTSWYKMLDEQANAVKETAEAIKDYSEVVDKVIHGDFGNGQKRMEALAAAGFDYATIQALVNKKLYGYDVALKDLTDDQIKAIAYDEAQVEALKKLRDEAKNTGDTTEEATKKATPTTIIQKFLDSIENLKKGYEKFAYGFEAAWKHVFGSIDGGQVALDVIGTLVDGLSYVSKVLKGDKRTGGRWFQIFRAVFNFVKDIFGIAKALFDFLAPILGKVILGALVTIFDIVSGISLVWNNLHTGAKVIGRAIKRNFLDPIKNWYQRTLKPIVDTVKKLWNKYFKRFRKWTFNWGDFINANAIATFIDKIGAFIRGIPDKAKKIFSDTFGGTFGDVFGSVMNTPLVQNFIDKVKELADKFGLLDFSVEKIPEYFTAFIDKLKDGRKYIQKFKDAIGKLVEKLYAIRDALLELKIVEKFIDILDRIASKAERAIGVVKSFILEKLPGKLSGIVKSFKEWWKIIKDSKPLEAMANAIGDIFTNITSGKFLIDFLDQLIVIKDFLMGLFGKGEGIGEKSSLGVSAEIIDGNSFDVILQKIKELIQPIQEALGNLFGDPVELKNKAFEGIKSILQGIADAINLKNFNADTAKRLFATAFIIISAIKLFNGIESLLKSTDAMKAVLVSISDVFDAAADYIDAKTFSVTAKSVWQVAKSLLLMALAIVALGYLDEKQIGQAVAAILVVALAMTAFMWALSKVENALAKRQSAKNESDALHQAAETAKKASGDIQSLATTFTTGLTGAVKLLAQGLADAAKALVKGIAKSFTIIALVYALTQVVGIINDFLMLDWSNPNLGPAVGAILVSLGLLLMAAKLIQAGSDSASIGDALMFVALAKSLQMIVIAVAGMGAVYNQNEDAFWNATLALYGFIGMLAVLALVMKNVSKSEGLFNGGGGAKSTFLPLVGIGFAAVAIGAAMTQMAVAVAIMSKIPADDFARVTDVLGTFGLLLIVLIAFSKNYGEAITGGTGPIVAVGIMAVLVAVALNMMVPALSSLSVIAHFDPGALGKAVGVMAIMMLVMGILSRIAGKGGGKSMLVAAGSMIILAKSMQIMVNALLALAAVMAVGGGVKDALIALVEVLVIMGVALGILTVVAKFFGAELWEGIVALVAMAGALTLIGAGLWLFNEALLVAGKALPAFAEGLVAFSQKIIEGIPVIIGAIFAIIAAISIAIIAGSNMAAAAVVVFITAIITAGLMALSQVSTEAMAKAGQMLGIGVVKVFIFLWNVIWGALAALFTWFITTFPQWVQEATPSIVYGIKMILLSALEAIINFAVGPLGWVLEKLFGVDFSNQITGWIEGLKEKITKSHEELKAAQANEPEENIFVDPEKVNQDGQETATAIENNGNLINDKINSAVGLISGNGGQFDLGSLLGGVGDKLSQNGENAGTDYAMGVLTGAGNVLNADQGTLDGQIVDLIAGDGTMAEMQTRCEELMGNGMTGMENGLASGDVNMFGDWIDKYIGNGEDKAETHSPSKRTERLGQNLMEGLEAGINSHEPQTNNVFANAVNNMLTGAESILEGLGARATAAMAGFNTAVTGGFNGATEAVGTFTTSASEKVGSLPESFGTYAATASSNFKAGLERNKRDAINAAKSIASSVKRAIDVGSSFYNIAVNAGNSFVNGLRSKITAAANAAAAMMKAAKDKANETLDIHSPSKVFRSMGYNTGEGYIQGVQKMIRPVERVAESMAVSSIDGMRMALQDVDTLLSSDLNLDPVITPVLDLSDVRTGLGTLDTMMARSEALNALTGIRANESKWDNDRAISNSLNAIVANSGNGDVVSAIESLKADNAELRAAIASMRIVMNNRFVGQVDASLGRQQKLVNRG